MDLRKQEAVSMVLQSIALGGCLRGLIFFALSLCESFHHREL